MKLMNLCTLPLLSMAVAGCGQSEASKAPVEPPVIGYFSSTKECRSIGKLPLADCVAAIEQAGVEHDTRTALYSKLKLCEAAAGAGNCEPAGGDYYRPRLQAFLVVKQGPSVTARALYAVTGSSTPFKDLDGNLYSVDPDTTTVAPSVLAIASTIMPGADASGGIGEAAANVH